MRQALEMALDWIQKQPEEITASKYDVNSRYVFLRELEAALAQPEQEHNSAIKTLKHLKYTYHGGEYWKPPLGELKALAQLDQDEIDIRSRLYQRIHELETQLAQPEQEPWRESASDYERGVIDGRQMQMQSSVDKAVNRMAQPKQEPVAWYDKDGVITANPIEFSQPLYTTSPQRKPLMDEQRKAISKGWQGRNWTVGDIIDAIEAAHGIKE